MLAAIRNNPHIPVGQQHRKICSLLPKSQRFSQCLYQVVAMGSRLCIARSQHTAYAVTWKGEQNHERSHRWFSGQSWKWRTSLPLDQDLIHSPIKRKLGNGDAQKEAAGLCHRYTTGPGHFIILCKSSSNIHLF